MLMLRLPSGEWRSQLLSGGFAPNHLRPASAVLARDGFGGRLDGGFCSPAVAEAALSEEIVAIFVAVGSKKRSPIKVIQ
jgi:hypothetical protein